jgi:DNA repair exonuclease SbcCD ATPase subunit
MLPLKLDIENFYCHSKSIINFDDFQAAVIVGKINGNDKFSNGAGKSTIFAAIKYVLFNEVDTSSLEKVIKHDADSCKVAFEFQSSLDNQIYKIIRFRGRKPGAEVRLFKKINGEWEDLTQRTPTETDKEIVKLIKINYRTFSNSVLFAQGDMSGIAAMTPRERKTALKEALQLGIYSKYESSIKKKVAELTKEVEKTQTIIATLGKPEKDIIELASKLELIKPSQEEFSKALLASECKMSELTAEIITKQKELNDLADQIKDSNKNLLEVDREIFTLNSEISKYSTRISELERNEKISFDRVKALVGEIKSIKSIKIRSDEKIKNDINDVRSKMLEQESDFKQLTSKYKDLSVPLTEDAVCKHCRQTVDPKARALCQASIDTEKQEISARVVKLKSSVSILREQLAFLEKEQDSARVSASLLKDKDFELEKEKKNTMSSATMADEFKGLKSSKEKELKTKEGIKLDLIAKYAGSSLKDRENILNKDLGNLKAQSLSASQERKHYFDNLSSLSNEEAVLNHKIQQKNSDKEKIANLQKDLLQLEYQFALHQKVLTAFGPSGIPALITHTILDDYQIESNNMLDRLRPGLRLQFLTENERSDGEMSDTLEITYFLNNTELEFSQLSGAQKLLVSLALRLGLAAVISKRLGIDLKMILIDEADQSLDEAALETFEQAIKELQKDYKILIITHNNELKMKFSHAIVVEQDNNLNSTAKVSNGW